jgi:hypothetical protein
MTSETHLGGNTHNRRAGEALHAQQKAEID